MFELKTYRCPDCGMEIREGLVDGQVFDCANCRRKYRVLLDSSSSQAGFVPMEAAAVQEPLGLPKGSIRAIATLTTAGCCWALMLLEKPTPGYLLGLLLTVIGYYFGFRQRVKAAGSRILDASTSVQEPLNLPGGTIRMMLIGGFGVCAFLLAARGRFIMPEYLEFFIILAGLVGGYFFARLFAGTVAGAVRNIINHAKGLIVLVATIRLAVLLLAGGYLDQPHLGLALACIISFYFGSRS